MAGIEEERWSASGFGAGAGILHRNDYVHITKDIAKRIHIPADGIEEFENGMELLCISITRRVLKACEIARTWNRNNNSDHQVTQPLHLLLTTCHPLEIIYEIDNKLQFSKIMRQHFLKRFATIHIKLQPYKPDNHGGQLITRLQAIRRNVSKMFIDLELIIDKLNNDNEVNGDLLVIAVDAVMNTQLSLFDLTLQVIDIDKERQSLQSTNTAVTCDPLQSLRQSLMKTRTDASASDASASASDAAGSD